MRNRNIQKTLFFIVVSVILINFSRAQNNQVPYNSFDKEGKKHGYWKVFIDSNLISVKDSTEAVWYYYSLYYHGENMIDIERYFSAKTMEDFEFLIKPRIDRNKISPIDGEFFIKKEPKRSCLVNLNFEKGYMTNMLLMWDEDGSWVSYDFNKKYKGIPYSFYCESPNIWNKKLNETYYYFIPDKKKVQKKDRRVKISSKNYYQYQKINE